MAVSALNPDVAIIHAQQADRRGNVAIWGIAGIQKEAVLSAKRVIVTVEEVVDHFEPRPFQIVLPSVAVEAVAVVAHGAHPSYADGYGRGAGGCPSANGGTGGPDRGALRHLDDGQGLFHG
jgi:glutaconate CoA-transferase subunit A